MHTHRFGKKIKLPSTIAIKHQIRKLMWEDLVKETEVRDAKKQAGGVANEVSDAESQVADAATNAARKTASSFEKAYQRQTSLA